MKRKFLAFTLTAMMAISLTACGSKETNATAKVTETESMDATEMEATETEGTALETLETEVTADTEVTEEVASETTEATETEVAEAPAEQKTEEKTSETKKSSTSDTAKTDTSTKKSTSNSSSNSSTKKSNTTSNSSAKTNAGTTTGTIEVPVETEPEHVHHWVAYTDTRVLEPERTEEITEEVPVYEQHYIHNCTVCGKIDLTASYNDWLSKGNTGSYWDFECNGIQNYACSGCFMTEMVQVGTETQVVDWKIIPAVTEKYVAYYYCSDVSCNATKPAE